MKVIVSDSSPLIALLNINKIELLRSVFHTIIIPQKVALEVECGEKEDSPWFALKQTGYIQIQKVNQDNHLAILKLQLDAGESEAILLAKKHSLRLLIDERAGRNIAQDMGLEIIGLVGVLYALKQSGNISPQDMLSIVKALERAKFRMSAELKTLLLS